MKGIISWFAHNSVAANLLMLIIGAGGLLMLPIIQQKSFPDIDVNVVQVGVAYLGAAPEEVEEGVCVRIEEAIHSLTGIDELSSTATEGNCGVGAELLQDVSVDRALTDIRNAVDGITTFPEETEKPVIQHFEMRRNALQLALSGDVDERTLKIYGERIRDEIAALHGVTQVDLSNARGYEISIEVSEEALRRHNLSFDQVVEAIRRSSLDMPGGSLRTKQGEILLRTKGQAYRGPDFEDIVVVTRTDGTRLQLSEVAQIRDSFEEDPRNARFDGEPAVMIQVYRVGEQKVIELVETVKAYVETAQARLPDALRLTIWRDGSQSLRDRLGILLENAAYGFVLVFVLLACFLRLRLAFWVCVGVPVAFLGALAMFPVLGLSIDVITLFAFILVLGLLVDDAIVVAENVHRHQEAAEDPLHAAVAGTQEVSVPVIFGVLTTVAAFIPLVTAAGAMGQIFSGIGQVVICCLVFSVVESQLILPAHLGHSRRVAQQTAKNAIQETWARFQTRMSSSLTWLSESFYQRRLEQALAWRYVTLSLGITTLVITIGAAATGSIRYSFFPPVESDYISAVLTMPAGTPGDVTAAAIRELEASALRTQKILDERFPDSERVVQHVLASVGEHPGRQHGSSSRPSGGTHLGEVSVELAGGDDRPISASAVADLWREQSPAIPDAEELVFNSSLFRAGEPINLRLQSGNVEDLRVAATELKLRLAEYPGVFDINDSYRGGKREIKLSILPTAETLGLTLRDLAKQVRQAFYGEEVQRIQRDREDIRVMVRYPESQRRALADLESMRIRTPDGSEVPFYTVARAEFGRGYASIRRTNRQRSIVVVADVDPTLANAGTLMEDLETNFIPQLMANHPGLSYREGGEQRERQRVSASLFKGFGFALLLIYALLAIPLRSYFQPLVIMAVIPFGLVGAVGGHIFMARNFTMMSVFGVVALSGVVVNSSLVLVHYINSRRDQGIPILQAVRDAGVARFRPIVLTSLTTFAGLSPLLLERSVSAQFLIPMAISLAFGIVFATLISLFLVPSAYVILEDVRGTLGGSWRWFTGGPRSPLDDGVEMAGR